jgi:hypothetical protein
VAPGLLQHRFPEATAAGLLMNTNLSGKAKETPQEQAEAAAYRLANGQLCQPGEHVFQSILKAATSYQIPGRGKKTYKDAVKGGLLVTPDYIPHKEGTEFLIYSVPVAIQKARVMRHRPLIRDWRLTFELVVLDHEMLPIDALRTILDHAGAQVGIGDYRPRFGRFSVINWSA